MIKTNVSTDGQMKMKSITAGLELTGTTSLPHLQTLPSF